MVLFSKFSSPTESCIPSTTKAQKRTQLSPLLLVIATLIGCTEIKENSKVVIGSKSSLIIDNRRDFVPEVGWDFVDNLWDEDLRHELTYCVSLHSFPESERSRVVKELANAARKWEDYANVHFIHRKDQDATCSDTNFNVLFNVKYDPDINYPGSAFFPDKKVDLNARRQARVLKLGSLAFNAWSTSLERTILHELGHTLGLVHEFESDTVPTGQECSRKVGHRWKREVTHYDRLSIMNYYECNGTMSKDLSDLDKFGIGQLYGQPTVHPSAYSSTAVTLKAVSNDSYIAEYSDGSILADAPSDTEGVRLYIRQNDDGTVSLQSEKSRKFLINASGRIQANGNSIEEAEDFILVTNPDHSISLRTVRATPDEPALHVGVRSGGRLAVSETTINIYDKFVVRMHTPMHTPMSPSMRLVGCSNPYINLKASNGMFVVAENGGGGSVNANRSAASFWELFEIVPLYADFIALKAINGQYLVAEGGGGREVLANRNNPGAWETFRVVKAGNGYYGFQANNGQFMVAEGGGGGVLNANRDRMQSWETFQVICK